jgi:hypothetical protein
LKNRKRVAKHYKSKLFVCVAAAADRIQKVPFFKAPSSEKKPVSVTSVTIDNH